MFLVNLNLKIEIKAIKNKIEGIIPIEALASKAPIYDRKWSKKKLSKKKIELKSLKKVGVEEGLIKTVKWYLDNEKWWKPLLTRHNISERLGANN